MSDFRSMHKIHVRYQTIIKFVEIFFNETSSIQLQVQALDASAAKANALFYSKGVEGEKKV